MTLKQLIAKALTRKRTAQTLRTRALRIEDIPPSDRLVLAVQIIIVMTLSVTALEFAHLVILNTWNSEVFAGLTGLIGTLLGVLLGRGD